MLSHSGNMWRWQCVQSVCLMPAHEMLCHPVGSPGVCIFYCGNNAYSLGFIIFELSLWSGEWGGGPHIPPSLLFKITPDHTDYAGYRNYFFEFCFLAASFFFFWPYCKSSAYSLKKIQVVQENKQYLSFHATRWLGIYACQSHFCFCINMCISFFFNPHPKRLLNFIYLFLNILSF